MKFASALLALSLWLPAGSPVQAAGPDDTYLEAYRLIQEADQFSSSQSDLARLRYRNAEEALKRLQTAYPNYNKQAVDFRLEYIRTKLQALPAVQSEASPTRTPQPARPSSPPSVAELSHRIGQLEAENQLLQGKLQEAMAPRPAAVDPAELGRAQEQIKQLEKEKELLRAALSQAQAKQPNAGDAAMLEQTRSELAATRQKLVENIGSLATLTRENLDLKQQLARPAPPVDNTSPELRAQVASLQAEKSSWQKERADLETKLAAASRPAPPVDNSGPELRAQIVSLQTEKSQLQKERAALETKLAAASRPAPPVDNTSPELRAQIASLQTEKSQLQKERSDLETKLAAASRPAPAVESADPALRAQVASLQAEKSEWQKKSAEAEAKAPTASKSSSDQAHAKELEKERDALLKKLNDANKELYDVKARGQAAQFQTITNQLSNLRARLEVFEARKVPFTKEELALMDKAVPKLAVSVDPKAGKKPARELPAGAAVLIADAERAFAARRYTEAEEKYQQVLKLDENNPVSLANLAAIQLELQKLDEADANLKKAIAAAPEDGYPLSLMGMLRFQQGKFEEALDALSRSAQLDPKNPETQNYLGITLSQQGQREAAETALRKAITLNPNYAGAHHNLAVVYATQKPPFVELAKYHYNRALALGQPPNADLEKQIGR